jgi:hypothetical protein
MRFLPTVVRDDAATGLHEHSCHFDEKRTSGLGGKPRRPCQRFSALSQKRNNPALASARRIIRAA